MLMVLPLAGHEHRDTLLEALTEQKRDWAESDPEELCTEAELLGIEERGAETPVEIAAVAARAR